MLKSIKLFDYLYYFKTKFLNNFIKKAEILIIKLIIYNYLFEIYVFK